ncbi:hypothetical protein Asru_0822_02 [Acidisphaera rubrifaciens HS-AP3]|uniref:Uncharacterized protein n=1 Tax=Acidisphaera rubrifaciens HS-AP3 TaxID=1231350 RepID=A0A0D6P9S0_9PROT|nr:hypothetical protein Asru_0822_02 [Acidisphaera rubrifaciens HS-AP3]
MLHLLGTLRYRQGALDEAAFLFTAVLGIDPDHASALNDLACVALAERRPGDALGLLDRAIAIDPTQADAHLNRGNALLTLEQAEAAGAAYEEARALRPTDARALSGLATIRRMQGRNDEALTLAQAALEADPDVPGGQTSLGTALQALGRGEEARVAFRAALARDPADADALNNLGTSLIDAGAHEEGLAALRQATVARPGFALAWFNLANALVTMQRADEAITAYQRLLALEPRHAEALHNMGGALMMLRDADGAVAAFRAARRGDDDTRTLFSESLALLTLGDYPAGFAAYEARLAEAFAAPQDRHLIRPRWHGGRDVAGRRVLLYAEQGYGDNVQFCRYAPLVAARGAHTIIEAPAPLLPLLRTLPWIDEFVPTGEPLPEFDLYCPMASLPLAFGTTLDSVPATVPYLFAEAHRVARWRPELLSDGRRRVGIAWSGNPGFGNDRQRSLSLALLEPLRACGVALHVVQQDVRAGDRAVLDGWPDVRDLSTAIVDFADTAAILSLMDLVISVDTSIAHVAGAIGVPVWVLLPYAADWRWLRRREDSIWYPTARLFRQETPGDWPGVIAAVVAALASP